MKKFLLIAVALLAWGTSFAQEAPLIDREIFFDNPEIAGAQLSPDAKWMTFTKAHKGTMNIWLKRADEPFEAAKPITADTVRPIRGYFWTDDSRFVLYGQDKGGNEDFHVYAVDPFAKAETATGVPPSRDLTPYEKTTAQIYRVSKKDPNKMWVGLNDRDQAWHDLYEINIATGARKLLRQNDDRITGWDFDWDETLRFASRSKDDGTTDFLRVDADKLTEIYKIGPLDEAYIVSFTKDNKQPYFVTNKDRNFTELTLLDPATGKETFVEKDPLGKVDFGGASFNDLSREMEYTVYTDSKNRIYWRDKKMQAEYEALEKKFPGKEIDYVSLDKKQEKALLRVWSDTDPGAVYFYDRKTGKTTFQYRPRPKLKPEHLAPMQAITYKSSDGLEIPAFLTTPKGKEAKNLPLMVIPHGGPWARDYWGYNSYAQFWSNRGYAVLQMNFRGSTGYGKDFLNKGNGEWGQLMQDDITWGVKDLVAKGIADPNHVGILGGSYGGYATLAGVTYTPDLYKAAVAIVAPSNLNTLLASVPSYWESFRKIMYLRMADPNTPEGKAQLERQSPLNHVDKIKTPLMIVQGANDPRVKKAEADQIVVAMREKGIPVEYICAPDEGHGFARPVNNMAYLASAEKFLATRLGGRYQASMTDEVAKRLSEITVDIKTVEKPKRADEIAAMAAGKGAKPIYDLAPGTFEYKIEIALGAQKIPMNDQRTVKSKGDHWEISDAMTSMMGVMSDVNLVRKKTLQPVKRNSTQGPVTMEMEFTETEVKGKINMGSGADQPFSVANDKPLAPDGAGGDLFLAALDWKEGATYYYTTFDPQSQQLKTQEAKAVRKEKVTVPAGTYDAWVIEVKNTDGSGGGATNWIADNLTVKSVTSIPEMGGALLTVELVKFEYERP